jgi:hypothetical protein
MDNELRLDIHGSLSVVALHETIGARHDARLFASVATQNRPVVAT